MVITPVQGQAHLLPPSPASPQKGGPVSSTSAAALTPLKEGAAPTPLHERVKEIDPPAQAASASGLEVRLHVLPDEGATILQFVDPGTKQVVREFPAEDRPGARRHPRWDGQQLDETA